MEPALAQRINEIALPLGPVPGTGGHLDVDFHWCEPQEVTAAELVERMIDGKARTPAQERWLLQLLMMAMVRSISAELPTP